MPTSPAPIDYVVRWRRTDAANWEQSDASQAELLVVACRSRAANRRGRDRAVAAIVLQGIRVDDWVFGVSSVSKDGFESPVASAVPAARSSPTSRPPPPEPVK